MNNNAEALRLYYLQSMGISSYYPRFVLPGALASTACEWPPEDTAESAAASVEARPDQQQPSVSQPAVPHPAVPKIVAEPAHYKRTLKEDAYPATPADQESKPRRHVEVAEQQAAAVAKVAVEDQGDATRLQLLLMPVDADLAVLNQIPVLSNPRMQERQQVLLQNILRWLGKHENAAMPVRHFQWPLPGMALSNTKQQAGLGLIRFLEQACVEHSFRYLLVLGEQAADCLGSGAFQTATPVPWQMLATCSIDEMLAMPQLKREAWQTLLPLHAALQP